MRPLADKLASVLFWDQILSVRERQFWLFAFALAPLAFAASYWLQHRIYQQAPVRLPLDRQELVAHARDYLKAQGRDVTGWSEAMRIDSNLAEDHYRRTLPASTRTALNRLVPGDHVTVFFRSSDAAAKATVSMDLEGRGLGYDFSGAPPTSSPEPAELLARRRAQQRLGPDAPVQLGAPEVSTHAMENGKQALEYLWHTSWPGAPALDVQLSIRVREGGITKDAVSAHLDEKTEQAMQPWRRLNWLKNILGFVFIFGAFILVLVRYLQRTLQHEVSHWRTALVGVTVGGFFFFVQLLSDLTQAPLLESGANIPLLLLIMLVVTSMMGLASGFAYSATEGDLREVDSSKMVSLDALLGGRLLSRQTARAFFVGLVMSGWIVLGRALLRLWLLSTDSNLDLLDPIKLFVLSRLPWLAQLLSTPFGMVSYGIFGLLLPVSAARLFLRRRRLSQCIWMLVSFCGLLLFTREDSPLLLVAVAAVKTVFTLLVFTRCDLLTAVIVLATSAQLSSFLGLSELAPFWWRHELTLIGLMSGAMVIAAYFTARGRLADPVRLAPQYARDIAERVSLQEELSAAREAQRRLLPRSVPQIEGLSIAATCRPADLVGGDFYDFFVLSPTRLGVLITEGGGRGLGTALSIALTKGYLMQKVSTGLAPAEIVRQLQQRLMQIAGIADCPGLCLMLIDTHARSLQYVRWGESPRLLLTHSHPRRALHVPAPPAEWPKTGSVEDRKTLHEGSVALEEGLRVFLYTDGIAQQLGRGRPERWLREQAAEQALEPADRLMDRLMVKLFARRGWLRPPLKDDVTLVVLGVEQGAEAAKEQVA